MLAQKKRSVKPKINFTETAAQSVTGLFKHASERFPYAYILVATKKKNAPQILTKRAVTLEKLDEYLQRQKFSTEVDYYLTQNLYKGGFRRDVLHWRKQEHLLSLANIVVDVDMHTEEDTVSGVRHRRERLRVFEEEMRTRISRVTEKKLDYTCVFTGRGLQFWFPIEPTAYACRWMVDALTNAIVDEFKAKLSTDSDPYGFYSGVEVDSASSARLSGLFRFPLTQNTKGGRSTILHTCKAKPCHPKELLELFDILPEGSYRPPKAEKKPRKGVKSGKKRGTRAPRYVPLMTRRKDFLETILPNIHVGRRTVCLLSYASTVRKLFDVNEAEKAVRRFNACYSVPLPKSAVDAILKEDVYRFRKFKFLSFMEATDMEYSKWEKTYIPKWRKERIKAHEAFRAKMQAKWDAILKMRGEGKSYRAISRALHVSCSTIQRILGQQKAEATMQEQQTKVEAPQQRKKFKIRRRPAEVQQVAKPLANPAPVPVARQDVVPLLARERDILDLLAKEYLSTYHLGPALMQAFTSRGFSSVEDYLQRRSMA